VKLQVSTFAETQLPLEEQEPLMGFDRPSASPSYWLLEAGLKGIACNSLTVHHDLYFANNSLTSGPADASVRVARAHRHPSISITAWKPRAQRRIIVSDETTATPYWTSSTAVTASEKRPVLSIEASDIAGLAHALSSGTDDFEAGFDDIVIQVRNLIIEYGDSAVEELRGHIFAESVNFVGAARLLRALSSLSFQGPLIDETLRHALRCAATEIRYGALLSIAARRDRAFVGDIKAASEHERNDSLKADMLRLANFL